MKSITLNLDKSVPYHLTTYNIYDWYIYDFIYQPQNCNECILGDINNDSILNVLDIVSMITLILDGEFDECGDVNSDGDLNILDVITFVNIILSIS